MRISVLIPSRGRPVGLYDAVKSMTWRTSGEHDVRYVIGCDADDEPTREMAMAMWGEGMPVVPHIAARQPSLGGLVNMLALKCPADVYCSLADDVYIATNGWDKEIAEAWQAKPDGVWWWLTQNDATYAIVSEKWRAAAGRIFTDYFTFWFDDGWLLQVWLYASGMPGQMLKIHLEDRPRKTHRMRDTTIWNDFYWSPRCQRERMAEALRIRKALGWPDVEHDPALDMKLRADANEWLAKVEDRRGDKDPPTPEYLAALGRIQDMMKEAA